MSDKIFEYPLIKVGKVDPTKFKKGLIYVLGFDFKNLKTYEAEFNILKRFFKIGKTSNEKQRLKSHRTSTPFPSNYIHLIQADDIHSAELYIHRLFNHCNTYNEWFELSEKDLEKIQQIKYLKPRY